MTDAGPWTSGDRDQGDAVVKVAADGGLVEIVVDGEIDLANADRVGHAITDAITNRTDTAVVDLTGVTYMDSAGLHILFELAARLPMLQIALELVAPVGSQVRRVMDLCGLTSLVVVKPEP